MVFALQISHEPFLVLTNTSVSQYQNKNYLLLFENKNALIVIIGVMIK